MSITERIPLPVVVATTCAEFFGTKAKKYADNRCGKCPLRTPCLKHGETVARDNADHDESRRTFIAESVAILEAL